MCTGIRYLCLEKTFYQKRDLFQLFSFRNFQKFDFIDVRFIQMKLIFIADHVRLKKPFV